MDKSLILNNLKKLKNFNTDKELADFLGISKSTLSNWYTRNSIDYDLLFSKCEQNEVINLLGYSEKTNGNLMVNEDASEYEKINNEEVSYLDDINEPEVFYNERTNNKYLVYPDGTIRIEVLKVPFSAHASYVECFDDEVKLNQEFSKITFKVDHIGRGKYLGFESKGDSMWNEGGYDTPSGSDILGRQVGRHLWLNGFHKSKYGFILITKKGIYHKDIEQKIDEDGNLLLSSRNPLTKPFKISINDVNEIYHVIKRTF